MNATIQPAVDAEGYLLDAEDWDEDVAGELARSEGLELDEDVMQVLRFMREYWSENHVAPDVRHAVGHLAAERGIDKRSAKQHLFNLFPYGYVKQACKLAGMLKPRGWSTG